MQTVVALAGYRTVSASRIKHNMTGSYCTSLSWLFQAILASLWNVKIQPNLSFALEQILWL